MAKAKSRKEERWGERKLERKKERKKQINKEEKMGNRNFCFGVFLGLNSDTNYLLPQLKQSFPSSI